MTRLGQIVPFIDYSLAKEMFPDVESETFFREAVAVPPEKRCKTNSRGTL